MTGVDCNCTLRLQVLFGDARENFLFDLRQAFSRRARNTQRLEMFPVTVFRQIAFVQKQNFTAIVGAFLEMWRPWRVAIHDVETQVRGLERFFGARDSLALEFACRRSQAGGIEQADWHTTKVDHFLDRIAGRAVGCANVYALITKKLIKPTRLARTGRTISPDSPTF